MRYNPAAGLRLQRASPAWAAPQAPTSSSAGSPWAGAPRPGGGMGKSGAGCAGKRIPHPIPAPLLPARGTGGGGTGGWLRPCVPEALAPGWHGALAPTSAAFHSLLAPSPLPPGPFWGFPPTHPHPSLLAPPPPSWQASGRARSHCWGLALLGTKPSSPHPRAPVVLLGELPAPCSVFNPKKWKRQTGAPSQIRVQRVPLGTAELPRPERSVPGIYSHGCHRAKKRGEKGVVWVFFVFIFSKSCSF